VRNRIEHGDEDIAQGRVPINSVPFLMLLEDKIVVGDEALSYPDLAVMIRFLVDFVGVLLSVRDP